MSYQHKKLASGSWSQLNLAEQMANIGSEVERALKWKQKGNAQYCQAAFERSLELVDLTLADVKGFARLKEIARLREVLVDYFSGSNMFASTDNLLSKYFLNFNFAARKNH